MERFQRKTGAEDTISFGAGYDDARRRLLLPANDPEHIGSVRQIMQMTNDKLINDEGEKRLIRDYNELQAHKTTYGFQKRIDGINEAAKKYFSYDNPAINIKNDKGQEIYDTQWLNSLYDQLDSWMNDGKNDPNKFPLFDRKELERQMQEMWPKDKKKAYYDKAVDDELGAAPNLPPAPEGTNATYWASLISNPPMLEGGKPADINRWAAFVDMLVKDPSAEHAAKFDRGMRASGIKAKDVLDRLGVKNDLPAPPGPEPDKSLDFAPEKSVSGD